MTTQLRTYTQVSCKQQPLTGTSVKEEVKENEFTIFLGRDRSVSRQLELPLSIITYNITHRLTTPLFAQQSCDI